MVNLQRAPASLAKAKGKLGYKLGYQQPAIGTDAKNFSFFLKMVLSSFQTQSCQNAEFHHDATRNFIHLIFQSACRTSIAEPLHFLPSPPPTPKRKDRGIAREVF
ncbi:hypothetical protein NDI44_22755 [Trichocoleus sp. DQ-A3]|uniref:hypothetical protein n=1 Tax=Cyanophyceae TaxID=3028117 RepID=UPI001F557B1C|nr:hypothetical protein [Coleofasciculus sp. FACHB-501]